MAKNVGSRDAWLIFKRFVRNTYLFCATAALGICLAAIISSNQGWLNIGWSIPSLGEVASLGWSAVTWLALNSGEVVRVISFGLLAWALFMAAMRIETIFNIVRGFNEARSPISQLHSAVQGVKNSTHEFDKNMGVLREFNERFKALTDQVIGLQEEAVSRRTDTAPLPAGADEGDEQNWEDLRAIWRRNNQRLEAVIKNKLTGARQRKYDNYPRTDYPAIIDRLYQDSALQRTAHEKSIELHAMFMSYKSRRKPVTEKVVADARILDRQLSQLIQTADVVNDIGESSDHGASVATNAESQHTSDLVVADTVDANDRPDKKEGA